MSISNIAIELPTNAVKAVRCYAPSGLSDVGRLLLDHYTNPISIFDLVSFGDIETLTASFEDIMNIPVLPQELYDDRDIFVKKNRTTLLFMYSYKTNRWEFLDASSPSSRWQELTNESIQKL